MQDLSFYILAFLTLLCGVMVVANPFTRSPVTSAMFLVLTMVALAGMFVLLGAFFLAAVQILVYAGAVIVLFLFVIMLLDLKEEARRKIKTTGLALGGVSVAALALIGLKVVQDPSLAGKAAKAGFEGGTAALGRELFTNYLLPFEIVSILLLVAMAGVILLSKKDLK
jgi:NADH-quinone oxidoreductase subunit J